MGKTYYREDGAPVLIGCLAILIVGLLFFTGWTLLAMALWNAFVPVALGGPVLDFNTAAAGVGLLLVIGILLRSSVTTSGK
jgi:hypothetical protein